VTGPAGVGKSTLVEQMVRWLLAEGRRVAVLAVDPSSPFTGGAVLGDRIRMREFEGEDGVFFRSMATRGARGGLARAAEDVCALLAMAGFAEILIETVGVGQDEVEVAGLADVVVVVLAAGLGDEVQGMKAGLMEAGDVFAVNQADRPGAERMAGEIRGALGLGGAGGWVAPVVLTVATTGVGVEELLEAVERVRVGEKRQKRFALHANPYTAKSAVYGAPGFALAVEGHVSSSGRLSLDHVGVAVKSIAAARGFYEALGVRVALEETVEQEQVRVAMLPLGESRVELIEATTEDSAIGRFVAKKGAGLHHIALRVPDVDAAFARMRAEGVRLASAEVQVGAGGHRYFFVHPESAGGVLVEIVG
jgi:LAO/AO transport system kinase